MKFIRILILALFALSISACNLTLAEDLTPPPGYIRPTPVATLGPRYPAAAPDPVNGAVIYAETCAPCHGSAGMGDGPQGLQLPASVTALGLPEVGRTAVPADWYTVITRGRMEKLMPPFASLTDQERWDVTAYALTLSFAPGQVEDGKTLIEASCPGCSLALFRDQQEMAALSQADLARFLREGGFNLPAYGSNLTDEERWSAAAYLRTLSFAPGETAAAAPAAAPGLPAETPAESTPEAAAAPESLGLLSGKIFNGSGGEIPNGLTVTLHGLDQDASGGFTEPVTLETRVQPDGAFSFEDVPLSPLRAFIVELEYGPVQYLSSPVRIDGAETSRDLSITLYETTADTTALSVDRWHIFLSFDTPGVIQVIELLVISNSENYVIVPPNPSEPALSIALPEDAANLQFQDGELGDGRYLKTAKGFGDLAPIKPGVGELQVVFAYDLPYTGTLEFFRRTDLPVYSAVVMVPDGVRLKSDLLERGAERVFQGVTVVVYDSQPLPAGAALRMEVSGAPGGSAVRLAGQPNILFAVGALGVLLILAGVYMFWRERVRPQEAAGEAELSDRDSLLDAIIALDDLHKAGKLNDDAYLLRRAELKSRLREFLQQP
jgi:mono/diheme cytochrome c family protein